MTTKLPSDLYDPVAESLPLTWDLSLKNIILTGRPNSGVENMVEKLINECAKANKSYTYVDFDTWDGNKEFYDLLDNKNELFIINDSQVLLSDTLINRAFKSQIVWVTPHLSYRYSGRYVGFFASHHYGFAHLRNHDTSPFPAPYNMIGDKLPQNYYVDIFNSRISSVAQTQIKF